MFYRKRDRGVVSLRTRLAFSTVAAVAIALAVGFVWARRNLRSVLIDQVDETLVNKSRELSAVASGGFETLDLELHREIEVYESVGMTVRVDLPNGRSLIAPDDRDGRRLAAKLKGVDRSRELVTIPYDDRNPTLRAFCGAVQFKDGVSGSMVIAVSLDRTFETLRLFDQRVLLGGLMLLVIAVPVGLWLYRQALRPVTKAVQAAKKLDPKDMTARLPGTGTGDELDQLSSVINDLLAKLEAHHTRVAQFTADASHELRTPLAAMRTSIDVALQRPRNADDYRSALESLGEQCDRLSTIVEKLQWLARADAGRMLQKRESVDLSKLVCETVEFLSPLAEEKGVQLRTIAGDAAYVVGDVAHLRQALVNLIDNAVKFTPSGGEVRVSVHVGDEVSIAVEDTGIGIAEPDPGQLFERFYRSNAARTLKGTGLGLSICKSIVEAHGGRIAAESRKEGGSVFRMTLPPRTNPVSGSVAP
jgi:heavy metal sensor kinase